MRLPIDSDIARLFRYFLLPFGFVLSVVGFVLMPLVPGPANPGASEYIFRIAPLLLAAGIFLIAAWLRKQEALDPAYEGSISKSLLVHFVVYAGLSFGVSLIALMIIGG
jgi:hypothetical protein